MREHEDHALRVTTSGCPYEWHAPETSEKATHQGTSDLYKFATWEGDEEKRREKERERGKKIEKRGEGREK